MRARPLVIARLPGRTRRGLRAAAALAVCAILGCDAAPLETGCSYGWVEINATAPRDDDDVDMLLVVDPSHSVDRERELVIREVARALAVLASGDHDEDGSMDFEPARSMRVAIVSSDLGAGALHSGPAVAGCEPGVGDGGAFLTAGDVSRAGCLASYPSVHEFIRGEDPDSFTAGIACVIAAVRDGCGVEQPLEAALAALSPALANESVPLGYVPPTFATGLAPLGDGTNAGFLRPRSTLQIIFVTDEDDASLAAARLDSGGAALDVASGDPVLGEAALGRGLLPVERYVDGFLALRDNPALVAVGVVAGIPTDLAGSDTGSYDRILDDARVAERTEATMTEPRRLVASCGTADGGEAFPPRRLTQLLRGLANRGASTTMQSVCSSDFRPVVDRVIELLHDDRLGGVCLPRALAFDPEGRVNCIVEELLPNEPGLFVTRCAELGEAATRTEVVRDALGAERERCEIRRLSQAELVAGALPGWFYDTSPAVLAACGSSYPPGQRISFMNHAPPRGADLRIRCRSPIPAYDEDGGAPTAACGD